MQITVNGKVQEVEDSFSLASLLQQAGYVSAAGIAAAVNDEVVPHARWKNTKLKSQDRILIITASQGG